MDEERRKRLLGLSGENNGSKFEKYEVPLIRFNGNTGEFRKSTKDSEEKIPVEKPLSVVILRKRKSLSSFKTNESMFSSQFSSPTDVVSLFSIHKGKVTHEMDDVPKVLREKYPLLKTTEIAYVLFNGEVHEIGFKGSSLANYYDYQTKLREEGKHCFETATVLNTQKAENDSGMSYYKITFEPAELDVDLDLLESKMVEVDTAIDKMVKQHGDSLLRAAQASGQSTKGFGELEQYRVGVDVGEDINPDDIPF